MRRIGHLDGIRSIEESRSMKTLYEPAQAAEIKARLNRIGPSSERQWGTMNPAQAMAHCAAAMEMALGVRNPPRVMIGRLLGRVVKPIALGTDKPFKRNSPTAPELVVSDPRQLDVEKQKLSDLIDRFVEGGREACTRFPHAFFGKLTADEWGVLAYKHLDHHLRQFGA
jgi:hypothetical protein